MKKRILSIIIIGVLGVSGLDSCGDNSISEKKSEVRKLQQEIKQEEIVKTKEKINDDMTKEEIQKFKNSYELWKDWQQKNIFTMCKDSENKDYRINESNRLMNDLLLSSPKGLRKKINNVDKINKDLMNYLSTTYNHSEGQNEEMMDMWQSVVEFISEMNDIIENMEG